MITFIYSLVITFAFLLAVVCIISYSKRKQAETHHGLTGMCHESGGAMCSCCSALHAHESDKNERQAICRKSA